MPPDAPDLSARVRELPHQPGVYIYRDQLGKVIYVGKAADLRKRVGQYFQKSQRARHDRKTRALVDAVWDVETHVVRSEAEAVLLEGKLIKQYRPKYNVSFRDDKRFLLIKINLNTPWPRFETTRLRIPDGSRYFGPYINGAAARKVIDVLSRRYGLRTMAAARIPLPEDHPGAATTPDPTEQADYHVRVAQACAFLEGQSVQLREKVQHEMEEAAAQLKFEKAARYRDQLELLEEISRPQKRFLRAFDPAPQAGEDLRALQQALALPAPPQRIECFDISNISDTHLVASMVRFTGGKPDRAAYRRYRIRTVTGQDDFASMAEVVQRRYSRVLAEKSPLPDLIILDGGKGQLSAALGELLALGLGGVPTIGLAKQHEEIYRPGESESLRLLRDHAGLKLLQRLRDEAHRFANSYHQLLLKKRMRESLLDDCPGLGEKRKQLLLARFGSVERLTRASAQEIAQTPGVGPGLAEVVAQYLRREKTQTE